MIGQRARFPERVPDRHCRRGGRHRAKRRPEDGVNDVDRMLIVRWAHRLAFGL